MTAEPLLSEVLATATPEKLLKVFASLTHQIHSVDHGYVGGCSDAEEKVESFRHQRDLVQREILRRMS